MVHGVKITILDIYSCDVLAALHGFADPCRIMFESFCSGCKASISTTRYFVELVSNRRAFVTKTRYPPKLNNRAPDCFLSHFFRKA